MLGYYKAITHAYKVVCISVTATNCKVLYGQNFTWKESLTRSKEFDSTACLHQLILVSFVEILIATCACKHARINVIMKL